MASRQSQSSFAACGVCCSQHQADSAGGGGTDGPRPGPPEKYSSRHRRAADVRRISQSRIAGHSACSASKRASVARRSRTSASQALRSASPTACSCEARSLRSSRSAAVSWPDDDNCGTSPSSTAEAPSPEYGSTGSSDSSAPVDTGISQEAPLQAKACSRLTLSRRCSNVPSSRCASSSSGLSPRCASASWRNRAMDCDVSRSSCATPTARRSVSPRRCSLS
mmetsp:Transcript_26904/g.52722  ORF Transcript_26904/g.52722 Transcript_26904/m.52722 type:complete len:223 (+) Transcript_26904:261-929(+)